MEHCRSNLAAVITESLSQAREETRPTTLLTFVEVVCTCRRSIWHKKSTTPSQHGAEVRLSSALGDVLIEAVLIAGGTDWSVVRTSPKPSRESNESCRATNGVKGRPSAATQYDMPEPVVIRSINNVKAVKMISGPSANYSIVLDGERSPQQARFGLMSSLRRRVHFWQDASRRFGSHYERRHLDSRAPQAGRIVSGREARHKIRRGCCEQDALFACRPARSRVWVRQQCDWPAWFGA